MELVHLGLEMMLNISVLVWSKYLKYFLYRTFFLSINTTKASFVSGSSSMQSVMHDGGDLCLIVGVSSAAAQLVSSLLALPTMLVELSVFISQFRLMSICT